MTCARSLNWSFQITGEPIEGWFDLLNGDKVMGKINLSVQYFPVECCGEDCREINMAYFPMRENNRLTLYQDADTPQLPQVSLKNRVVHYFGDKDKLVHYS